jgi:hypothetical protein
MRLLGVIGAEELPSAEDLAVALSVIRDALTFENALEALEKHYSGATALCESRGRSKSPKLCLVASKKR